jgi:predicted nucleic acid-binding protein
VRLLLDTNVLLDVLAARKPFYETTARIWSLAEHEDVEAFVSAISFNNVYYIVRKAGREERDARLNGCLEQTVLHSANEGPRLVPFFEEYGKLPE